MPQLSLLDPNPSAERPESIGPAAVRYADSAAILTRPTGRLAGLDFALNPYQGCTFSCSYCYAAFFVADDDDRDAWGRWVRVKTNAVDRLRRSRLDLRGRTVLMSSATDPYQPIERRLGLVRALLPILAARGAHLVIQTRSPIVARDIDLFRRFDHARVNLSITTDDDEVRKRFEPKCASIEQRFAAAAELVDGGIDTGIRAAPLLPFKSAEAFAGRILATGAKFSGAGVFHETTGPFAAGTRPEALAIAKRISWTPGRQAAARAELRAALDCLTAECAA